ncbi:hypothetical protein OIO90_002380 [Microbotryomycetes sp. JL221]|nr:hypothetical protein OIO90_002380 [Microbotryomycetes sp. JL221]
MGLWSRTYVCCAVPLYNVGVYAILSQFTIISLVTGILCFAAPKIIAATIPSFTPYILGVLCIVIAAFQLIGFLGVFREKPSLFKTYARFNTILIVSALVLSLVLIIITAVKHSTAVFNCENLFADQSSSQNQVTSATDVCNVWTWVQIGIMGLLFLIVSLCQAYFVMFTHIYSSEQKLDHAKYNSVYSTAAEEIRQSGLWDSIQNRSSIDVPGYPQQHTRQQSGLRNELHRYQDEIDQDDMFNNNGNYYDDVGLNREKGYTGVRTGVYPGEERFEPPMNSNMLANYDDPYATNEYYHHHPSQQRSQQQQTLYQRHPNGVEQAAFERGYASQGQAWDPAYNRY